MELGVNQRIRQIPSLIDCTSVDFTIFAPENVTVVIDLYAKIGGKKMTVKVNTTFCPPGFVLGSSDTSSRLECLCSKFIRIKLESTCNLTNYTISRPTDKLLVGNQEPGKWSPYYSVCFDLPYQLLHKKCD